MTITIVGFLTYIWPTRHCGLWKKVSLICWVVLYCNSGAIAVKMDGSVIEEKSALKMLRFSFPSKLDLRSYIISIRKTASKKIGPLIHSFFVSPEIVLYLYKSTIQPCMEYCCYVWADVPDCYLEMLYKLQKWVCRTVGPSLDASLEPLAHCRNVASLRLLYRYLVDVHLNRLNPFHYLFPWEV